jgi:ankyrin repeat protein
MIPISSINSRATELRHFSRGCEINEARLSPVDFVRSIIPANFEPEKPNPCHGTIERQEGFTMEAVRAIRTNDIAALRFMLASGVSFDACNSNGEYLIHLACRRSEPETVKFLIDEAKVRLDVRDSMGRSILHDLCWKSSPDLAMMAVVLRDVPPGLLLAKDARGFTPFDFSRKQHWNEWNQFLRVQHDFILERLSE